MSSSGFERASFRDRKARVFRRDGRVLRALNEDGLGDWEMLAGSRFFQQRVEAGAIVRTRRAPDEVALLAELGGGWAAVVEHDPIPFISYPYEWTFGMLRDAALLHLDLLLDALDRSLILKDSSAYNVQFVGARPVFIDTASFTRLAPGDVWHGYRQFCQSFLFPLMLQAYKDVPFQPWIRGSLEGIDARDMHALLSARDLLRPGVLAHVALHAKAQRRFEGSSHDVRTELQHAGFSPSLIKANVVGLRRIIEGLTWSRRVSPWVRYVETSTYSGVDLDHKAAFVRESMKGSPPTWVWDLGANTGHFARIAAEHARHVLAVDTDALAVDRMYRDLRGDTTNILPIIGNVTDPSPGLGWRGAERLPLADRGRPDLTLCLALLHHVVIDGNVPLDDFVDWIAALGGDVVVEFVTKADPMARRLLRHKDDQYSDYDQTLFEARLGVHYEVAARQTLHGGTRVLYHGVRRR
jgi:SAM-dependent methyltransferase